MRFFVSDGLTLPPEAAARRYDLAIAVAVLIHCTRDVCESLVAAATGALRSGGEFRAQLLADTADQTGIQSSEAGDAAERRVAILSHEMGARVAQVVAGRAYAGRRFRYEEAGAFLSRFGDVTLRRFDSHHIYARVKTREA